MANKDLVVKMTINSQDFDSGLKNAKASMNDFNTQIGNAAKSVGKFMVAVKAAQGALEVFKRIIGGTEQGADAMASAMYTAQSATRKFFQNLGDGEVSMRSFIDNLDTIRKNAQDAYEALDKLGTMKMWTNARMNQLRADIAEQRVIVNSETSTPQQKEEAKNLIRLNTERLTALSGDLAEQTTKAARAKLRDISGAGNAISDELLKTFVKWFEEGTLGQKAEAYRAQHAQYQTWEETVNSPGGWGAYTRTRGEWVFATKEAENMFNAMNSIAKAVESEGGLKDYYDLLSEEAAMRITVANQVNKANNAIKSGGGGSGGGKATSLGLTLDQQMQYLTGALQNEILNNDRLKDAMVIDFEIPEEEIFEPETEELMNRVAEQMKLIQDRTKYAAAAMSSFGQAFGYAADIAGDNPFGNTLQALSGVTNAAISTASAMMALTGAETMEGVAEAFASAPPFMKLAMAGTALAGILSMMAAVKSSFAGSYANGGIVGGNSYTGDNLWARVNSGEMIIPYNDWHNANAAGNVHFVIEGSQLKGVLDNYDKTVSL